MDNSTLGNVFFVLNFMQKCILLNENTFLQLILYVPGTPS